MSSDEALNVLIIEDSLNDVELLSSVLRNAGHAIRPTSAEDEEELQQVIDIQTPDLVLCAIDSEEPTLMQTCAAVHRHNKNTPIIATCDGLNGELQSEAMETGAVDLVDKQNHTHMKYVLNREIANFRYRLKMESSKTIIKELEKQCHALLDSSRDAIAYVHEGMHIYANPVYLQMFAFDTPEDVEGMPILDMVAPEEHDRFKKFLREYSKSDDRHSELELKALLPDGSTFNAQMEFSPASIDDEPCTQIIIRNQVDSAELKEQINYLSKQDLLTGLYNRQYFMEEMESVLKRDDLDQSHYALLYIEPDDYTDIKDKAGLSGTDLVLSDIAKVIQQNTGENDIAARFSDHIFTVLTHGDNPGQTDELADKLCKAIEHHISEVDGQSLTVTVSIGISPATSMIADHSQLMSNADIACSKARKNGGNCFHRHNPLTDQDVGDERDEYWVHLIRDALDNNRFRLIYQPIASLHGETTEKYELLLRLVSEEGEEIQPGQFLPAAEKNNMMNTIDRWVIDHAFEILADRRASGQETIFFIKLSGKTLVDETLLPWISQQLKKYRLQGDAVVFELSEKDTATYLKNAKIFCQGLQELHCNFCIEHFGVSSNPFQLLKHIKATYVKLDGALMHNLGSNADNQEKVTLLAEQADKMNIKSIAQFVEDANSLAVLWQSGVSYIQGHFLAEPDEAMNFDFSEE